LAATKAKCNNLLGAYEQVNHRHLCAFEPIDRTKVKKTRFYGIAMQGSPFSPAASASVEKPQR
jgi:hypothetical protein